MNKQRYGIFNQPAIQSNGSIKNEARRVNVTAGDYYGTGVKNPMGKMRDSSVGFRPVSKKQLETPPKSVV